LPSVRAQESRNYFGQRSLPALATLGLTPNTCAADWLEPKSVAFERHLNEIDRIAGERPIERYINKATKSG
jgi:hypothetical protein